MTFLEWYKQTAKDFGNGVTYDLVKDILVMAIRVAIEELMTNPADADLDITGIGRFYLNHRVCHNNFYELGSGKEYTVKWTIQFKPSSVLKDTINGKRDVHDLLIGSVIPLYPEHIYKSGKKIRGSGKKFKEKPKIREYNIQKNIRYVEAEKKMEEQQNKKEIKSKLPEVDE